MTQIQRGRQRFYTIFSYFYDFFIQLHSGRNRDETRKFLVNSAELSTVKQPQILDICCGTGSVVLSFTEKYTDALACGYDFSDGMIRKAQQKDLANSVYWVQGDAACLSFVDDSFDVVCCSHALYELKGKVRTAALQEMNRVVRPDGRVLIMEHEVPTGILVKMMFYLRMLMMGPSDAREFLQHGLSQYREIFSKVTLSHTPSGKSKLITCHKKK